MGSQVLVTFFVTVVLFDKVKVFSSDDDCSLHFGRNDNTTEDATTDRYRSRSKRAFLVDIGTFDSFLWSFEA